MELLTPIEASDATPKLASRIPSEIYPDRVCPICRGQKTTSGISSRIPAENLVWEDIQQSWRGLFKEKSFFSYLRCDHCKTLYCPTYFSESQLSHLYGSMDENMNEVPVPVLRRTQAAYFAMVRQYCQVPGGFLELGPDVGYFTEFCVQNRNFDSFWLLEPNRDVWDRLRSVVGGRAPVHLYPDHTGVHKIPDNSLSFVAAIHVLDHLMDPVRILQSIRQKLKLNGTVMCVTHDEHSLLARLLKARWPAFCLQHPQLYNHRSISTLFKEAGLNVIAVKKTVNCFPLGFLSRQALWATFRINPEFLTKLDFINLGLKLGNILTIAQA